WAAARGVACVLLLNNDVRLPKGFLEPLVRVLQNDPDVAGVGPTILRPDGRVWCQGARLAFAPNLSRLQGHGRPPAPPTHGPELVDYLPGACVLYREEDLRRAGGLDEDYFMYVEDADLGQRLRRRGKKLVWLPWIAVTHAPSSSSGGCR